MAALGALLQGLGISLTYPQYLAGIELGSCIALKGQS